MNTVSLSFDSADFHGKIIDSAKKRLGDYEDRSAARGATFLNPNFKKAGFQSNNHADQAHQQIEADVRKALRDRDAASSAINVSDGENPMEVPPPIATGLLAFLTDKVADHQRNATSTSDAIIIVRQYAELPPNLDINPIKYWNSNTDHETVLNQVAHYYLCIPATSVPAENLFSKAGYIISERRNSLSPAKARMLIFLHGNTRFG